MAKVSRFGPDQLTLKTGFNEAPGAGSFLSQRPG
jgi:hypothetical protein